MFKYLTQKWKQKRGFTLMEVMVVVAILAVIAGIAIPSVINMRKNMKFTERNDYAKAIFMAAQANLTEMRSKGELDLLQAQATTDNRPAKTYGAPDGYFYTDSSMQNSYALVLPVNSVDSTVRNEQVIIEYNPKAGIVYSVFYYEGSSGELHSMYTTANKIDRSNEEARKELLVGYYSVGSIDALDAQALDVRQTSSTLSYTNATQSVAVVRIPIKDSKGFIMFENPDSATYIKGLEVTLSVVGEHGGSFTTSITGKDNVFNFSYDNPNSEVLATFYLDSLTATSNTNNAAYSFTDISQINAGESKIIPGDNITITAEVTYIPSAKDPIVMIESSTIAGINPLYHSLTQNPVEGGKPYIPAISNARHLQNLQHLDGAFADANIESIVFVAQTEEDAVTNSGGSNTEDPSTPSSDPAEPSDGAEKARTAGTPNENDESESPSISAENTEITIDWADAPVENFTPIKFSNFNNGHKLPKIIGNGVEIKNLTISTTGTDTTGSSIGLFSVLKNTSIEGITLTNPTVTNNSAFLTGSNIDNAATTGALIGTAEGVTVKECCVSSSSDASYISGNQFVGGLVGFAKGNSTFEDCTANVTVKNVSSTAESTDNLPHILGGLVGYVEGPTATGSTPIAFTNCTTTATVTATTATDLGGMAGKAVNASFTGCSTEATVTGADGVLSNIGGLVGYAESVNFDNCDANANGAKVTSGEMTNASGEDEKNAIGGLVGYAGTATGGSQSTFKNCDISEKTTVVSANYAHSDIGGLVGYAKGAKFEVCSSNASVTGTQPVLDETPANTIPNNNLGGFVGTSENCSYTDIDVTLKTRPEYAMDAGGFAGILKGGEVNDLIVNLELPSGDDVSSADTLTYFGGIASRCTDGANIVDAGVIITGKMNNVKDNVAGAFAFTEGSSADRTTLTDVRVNVTQGTISSSLTAGLVTSSGSGTVIEKSYVHGYVPNSNSAGFVYDNDGVIKQCIANVEMNGGSAFVADNGGSIKDCYGWAKKNTSSSDNPALEITQNCSYSYFVNGSTDEMVMYEGLTDSASTKSTNILDTDALTDPWALELLNANETDASKCAWEKSNSSYPYPKLKGMSHVGDYEEPAVGNYPYSIEYTETYSDGSTGTYYIYSTGTAPASTLKNDDSLTVTKTSYVIYCRSGQLSEVKNYFSEATHTEDSDVPRLYSKYTQKTGENYAGTVTIGDHSVELNTYCAPGGKIRSGEQFANISHATGSDFTIERSITLSSSYSAFDYSGDMTAASGVTIDASAISGNLIDTLKGTLSGLTVTGLKAPMVNEISGGTVTDCDVSGEIKSGENVGIIAGTLSSGSIEDCVVSGSVTGSGYVGGVVGRSAGTIKDVTATLESVSSSDTNKTGSLVGYASAGTIQNCNASVSNATIPPFVTLTPKESIDKDAQYFSRTNHIPSNSDDNITRLYLGNSLSWAPIDEANFATYSSDVTISGCKLNNSSVPVGFVYYYKIDENLQCSNPSHAMDFIVMEEQDPQFDTVATNETQYYIHVSDDTYKAINNVHIEDRTVTTGEGESQKEETIHDFYYTVEGDETETVIKDISKSSKVSSVNLKLYKKSVHTPEKRTYMVFDAQGNQILIHNENGYQWQDYTTQYYSHMIWRYEEGVLTNMYQPDGAERGTINVGEAAGLITVTLKYNGTEKTCRLYPVDAYRNVELVDSAIVLDTSVLTK